MGDEKIVYPPAAMSAARDGGEAECKSKETWV